HAGISPCEELKAKVREQLTQIDRQFEALSESRNLLNKFLID
ncbi:MerR family transcriptional regulator, partial [Salmonella enterica]|nr:MerR family transcriptional regulator [Salmonella enterica]